ncbi:hypothetical protein D3C84_907710 [compost metagenome]
MRARFVSSGSSLIVHPPDRSEPSGRQTAVHSLDDLDKARAIQWLQAANGGEGQPGLLGNGEEFGLGFLTDGHQQAAAGLRIAQYVAGAFVHGIELVTIGVVVAQGAARHTALAQVVIHLV